MTSIDIESGSDLINKECLNLDSNSLQTSIQFGSSHDNNGSDLNLKKSEVNQIPSLDNGAKIETKIQMECAVNYSFIAAPKGLFEDKEIRNGFIRKVYSILFVQISVTIIISGIMITFFRDRLNFRTIEKNSDNTAYLMVQLIMIISSVVTIAISIAFCCSESARRSVPLNFILLGIFTIAESLMVGVICAQNRGENIIYAFIITGVVVLCITLLATTPWFDITNCGCLLCILLIIHVIMGILLSVIVFALNVNAQPWFLMFSIFGAFLFSLFLLYDTQQIMGGKTIEMSPEEYVYGAIRLYIDIIQIFLHILAILNSTNSSGSG